MYLQPCTVSQGPVVVVGHLHIGVHQEQWAEKFDV